MAILDDTEKVYADTNNSSSGSYTRRYFVDGAWKEQTAASFGGINRILRIGRRRPKPKYLDPTPYELFKLDCRGVRGEWSVTESGKPATTYRGSNSGNPTSDATYARTRFSNNGGFGVFDANQMDISRLNALRKLNFKDLDLGTAFAEAGKTMQLVGDVAHLSVDLIRAARRRDARGFMQRLGGDASHALPYGQSAVDAYLAYHYGVKPTLQDIAGSVQAMTRLPPEQWRVRATGASQRTDRKTGKQLVGTSCAVEYLSTLLDSCRTQISATRREISRADDLRWALGLDDPLSTAWELTPFSFVADWLFPVGDWLAAVNASKYFTNWQVSSTQLRREDVLYHSARFSVKDTWGVTREYDGGSATGGFSSLHIRRTVQSTLPMTTIPVKNPVSADHMAKGLSLLASALARGGEPPRFLRY